MTYLVGSDLVGGYGGANILNGCSIEAERGEVVVIVGPNGAGKSTAMKALLGMLALRSGAVALGGKDITHLSTQQRVQSGMGFVPQTHNVFPALTVLENLEMGAFLERGDFSQALQQVYELFPILWDKRHQPAGELSGGQRQQVAVGRALMIQPTALLLDEPTAGVSPAVMDDLFVRIRQIAAADVAVVMVEQNAKQALAIADKGYVLVQGENRFTGAGSELLADDEVRRTFLGG
ncbi:MAG: ABC transporter ATP-binding protein [Betaproteobacteria bacterium]|jgi:branched-chain amino acid transport system ATP-binding protein|nr:ABC transporter ATP-binding protein [Candidatus Fonsibacter lacus]